MTEQSDSVSFDSTNLLRFEKPRRYFRSRRAPRTFVDGEIGFLTSRPAQLLLDKTVSFAEFSAALRDHFASELQYEATSGLADRQPHESARELFAGGTMARAALFIFIVVCCGLSMPQFASAILILSASTYFLLIAAVRIGLAAAAQKRFTSQPRLALPDSELPVITILIPLFREAHALPSLIAALDLLNYPSERLDVKLLLEACDGETRREAQRLELDRRFDIIIVPPSHPQTKPKACNYGLACARGDLIVIYDAEDEPEADQLRIAAEIFAAGDDELACIQARLNYYNPEENWLTRLFTLEYCLWFDHFLPALDRLGAPVPLGGTSNIFRTDLLVEVGGWDPHNVTEDADLGLRLARRGYRTTVIESTTFEEANCRTGNWMRQRSRWMKGFIQTWLVHRRNHGGGMRDWRSLISVDLFVGGTALAALINPFLLSALLIEQLTGLSPLGMLPDPVRAFHVVALTAGNLSFIALAAFAPMRRGLAHISPAALLMPVYWIMMSIAAWRAVFQLLTRPSFWEKTDHGISSIAHARRAAALDAFGLEHETGARHFADIPGGAERGGRRSQLETPTE